MHGVVRASEIVHAERIERVKCNRIFYFNVIENFSAPFSLCNFIKKIFCIWLLEKNMEPHT